MWPILTLIKSYNIPMIPKWEDIWWEDIDWREDEKIHWWQITCGVKRVGKKQIWNFITVYRVVSEIWQITMWSSVVNTGTKLASIKSYIERLIWKEFGLEFISQGELLHWETGRYLMNWIQVVYIKLKRIWSLFAPAKAKKTDLFFLNESKSQSKFGLEVSSQCI